LPWPLLPLPCCPAAPPLPLLTHCCPCPLNCPSPCAPQIRTLDSHKLAACAGPQADCSSFVEFIQRNVALDAYRTGLTLSTKSTASFVKTKLAESLRKNPYQVNLLVGGYDKDVGASLYYIDYLGAMAKMPFAAHGYASYFLFSTLDSAWRPAMTEAQALDLARLCIAELAKRFTIHQPNFTVKVTDVNGVREVQL
jgi:20S proteasome subunit beta 4